MITFENTEIAFKSKTDKDLIRAYWLFKIIGYPRVVKFGKWFTEIALKLNLPIDGIIKKTIFKQFCGGTNIEDCSSKIKELNDYKIGTILDYSVEGKTEEVDFEKTTQEIIATILKAKENPAIPFAVFKVTGIATFSILEKANDINNELSDTDKKAYLGIIHRVERICQAAYTNNVPVFIDAEESWIQDSIDRITLSMIMKFNKDKAIVFNTLQMYRHDRMDFLKKLIVDARSGNYHYGIKLVRGAYMEKERERAKLLEYPSPIQNTKVDSDKDYNLALELICSNIDCLALCAGTHNEESSLFLSELIAQKGLDKYSKNLFFAQLLGMSDHISYNLAANDFHVAKYVPYGPIKEVLPYLLRRADENTSVAGQTSRELSLLSIEKNRRKK
jgi:proline dehydrogenase